MRDAEGLAELDRLKTGAMISAAAELGCIAAEMPAAMRAQALTYAGAIGRGFQIRDDMLDVEGDQAVFGKPIGSDAQEGKVTFVDVIGMDACRREVAACTEQAKAAVADWPEHAFWCELADRTARGCVAFIAIFQSHTSAVKDIHCTGACAPCTGRGREAPSGGRSCWPPQGG